MNLISKDDLFYLVKSLSKSEKRFLKLYAAATNLPTHLVNLFDRIDHKSAFTEDLFLNLKTHSFPAGLPADAAETLYNFILQCLRSYHAESNASFTIKDEVTNILNLFDKAQYKLCRRILNRQKQEAYRFERFHFILELISLEKLLITIETRFNIRNNTIENLVKESHDVIEKARNMGEYSVLFSTISLAIHDNSNGKRSKNLQSIEKYLQSPLLKNTERIKGKKALILYHSCRLLLFIKQQDNISRHKECHLILNLMNEHCEMIEEMPKRYLKAINSLISMAYESKKFKLCHEYIAELRSKINLKAFCPTDLQLKIFISIYNAELVTYTDSGKFDEAIKTVAAIEKGLREFKDKINKEEALTFYYNIAIMYTYAGDYQVAFKYITRMLREGDTLLRQDLQTFARVINLVLNYELSNFKQLTYIISSLKVYYKTRAPLFKTENLILTYIEKLAELKLSGENKERETLLDFKKETDTLMRDPNEKNVSLYFDIETYLESKITGAPMNILMQSKFKKAWQN